MGIWPENLSAWAKNLNGIAVLLWYFEFRNLMARPQFIVAGFGGWLPRLASKRSLRSGFAAILSNLEEGL